MLDPAAPVDRHDMIGAVLSVPDPGSILGHGDDVIVRVEVLTSANDVSRFHWQHRFAAHIGQ
jgi:hypothetical protein